MGHVRTLLPWILLLVAVVAWLRHQNVVPTDHAEVLSAPPEFVPFRTAGGTLQTNGFCRAEMFRQVTTNWRGTTYSEIQLTAIYRYEIELRSDWNIRIDDARHVAFVVAPSLRPQLPVATDSRSIRESTESGWGRFDKWEQLQALRQEISPCLERQANSTAYLVVARGQARSTVEEFAADWLLKHRRWPPACHPMVKVYFADEPNIPFPANSSLKDFLP